MRLQAVKDKEREMKQRKIDEEQRKRNITRERKQKKQDRERIARMAEKVSHDVMMTDSRSSVTTSGVLSCLPLPPQNQPTYAPPVALFQMSAKKLERKKKKLGLGNKKVAH